MVDVSGLSAVYPGFQKAQGVDLQNQGRQIEIQNAQAAQMGDIAAGNFIKSIVPGAQGMPGQMPPMMPPGPPQGPVFGSAGSRDYGNTPAPGQPSVPMRQPQPMQPQQPQGGGQPMGGAPMATAPQQGGMVPGGGRIMGGGAGQPQGPLPIGQMSLQQLFAGLTRANPGMPPQALMAAAAKLSPLLHADSQEQLRQLQIQTLSEDRRRALDVREREGEKNRVSRETIAKMTVEEREEAFKAGIISREQIAEANRLSRESEGAAGRESREKIAKEKSEDVATREKRLKEQFEKREKDRETDRQLKIKKDALSAQLSRERNAILAAGSNIPPAKLKQALDAAQKRHDDALMKLEHPNAKQAPDGKYYVPDPDRPGKYLEVVR